MDKLLEFGRKTMFYVRVLSGYEERRIRSYRIQLQQRLQQTRVDEAYLFANVRNMKYKNWVEAQARKAALNKVPEQIIISEVRKMVEDMQALNKKLEETETAIEEYFKPIDKEAEMIMKAQLEGEEKTMREMMATMQRQALLEKAEVERHANAQDTKTDEHVQETECADKKSARMG